MTENEIEQLNKRIEERIAAVYWGGVAAVTAAVASELRSALAEAPAPDLSAERGDVIGGFLYAEPTCRGCGALLTLENAWMTDGCPCNSALGINSLNETRWRLLMQLQQQQSHELERRQKAQPPEPQPDLDAIEARANAATPGPWWSDLEDHSTMPDYVVLTDRGEQPSEQVGEGRSRENADFIAHSREDIPALLAEVRRLRAEPAGWQPIETAPRMKNILLFAVTEPNNWKMDSGYYSEGSRCWIWSGYDVRPGMIQPTHWMPLPAPPESKA